MRYTLTLRTTETKTRTITIDAETPTEARAQLLALPNEQFLEDTAEGDIIATGEAFNTEVGEWTLDGESDKFEIDGDIELLNAPETSQ